MISCEGRTAEDGAQAEHHDKPRGAEEHADEHEYYRRHPSASMGPPNPLLVELETLAGFPQEKSLFLNQDRSDDLDAHAVQLDPDQYIVCRTFLACSFP